VCRVGLGERVPIVSHTPLEELPILFLFAALFRDPFALYPAVNNH